MNLQLLTNLYAPTADELRARLPDLADSIFAAISALYDDPQTDACEHIVTLLHGVSRHVMQLHAALRAEHGGSP